MPGSTCSSSPEFVSLGVTVASCSPGEDVDGSMSDNSCQWLDESIPTGGARSERTAPQHDRWENVAVEADPADMPNRSAWTAAEMVFNFGSSGLDAEVVAERQLEISLRRFGRQLVQTPRDGSCLFHAVRHGIESRQATEVPTVQEMRIRAVNAASREEVEVMAADSGCTVEAYRSQMLKSDTWGDELMIGMLSLTQRIAITLMTPVYCRTWSADGVVLTEVKEDAVWIVYNGRNHYYATSTIS